MTTPQLTDPAAIRAHGWDNREPSIGDTLERNGHELMWDGGQWAHSPDCPDLDQAAISTLRERLMLTLDEMAARMGVHRATVWRWEHGARPRPAHMRKLAKLAQKLEETR